MAGNRRDCRSGTYARHRTDSAGFCGYFVSELWGFRYGALSEPLAVQRWVAS